MVAFESGPALQGIVVPGAAGHIFVQVKVGVRENVETGTLLVADGDRQGILKLLAKAYIQHAGIERLAPHTDVEPTRTRKRPGCSAGKDEVGSGGEQNRLRLALYTRGVRGNVRVAAPA